MPAVTLAKDAAGNFILLSDQIYDLALVDFAADGTQVPMPAGDVQSVSSAGPFAAAVTVTLGTMPSGGPSVHVVSNVRQSDTNNGGGFSIVLTDSAGLPMAAATSAATFVVSPDMAAASEGIDFADVNATPNPMPPVAPGP